MTVKEFLDNDTEKLDEIVTKYPKQVPVNVMSECFLQVKPCPLSPACGDSQVAGLKHNNGIY